MSAGWGEGTWSLAAVARVSLAIKRQAKTNDEYLNVMTNMFAPCALKNYQRRWSIETFFQSVKQRGFRLEDTHFIAQALNPSVCETEKILM